MYDIDSVKQIDAKGAGVKLWPKRRFGRTDGLNASRLGSRKAVILKQIDQSRLHADIKVANIVKHSGAGEVEIDLGLEKELLILKLRDNGQGFDPSAANDGDDADFDWRKARGGNGILNMRQRARELGGDYRIESEPGRGTSITLSVPLSLSLPKQVMHRLPIKD